MHWVFYMACDSPFKTPVQDVTIEDMGPYPFIVTVTSEDGHMETKRTELGMMWNF